MFHKKITPNGSNIEGLLNVIDPDKLTTYYNEKGKIKHTCKQKAL
jgi:hypothetical protein